MKTTAVACLLMVAIAGSADAVSCLPCLAVFLGLPHYCLAVLMHAYLYLSEKTTGISESVCGQMWLQKVRLSLPTW